MSVDGRSKRRTVREFAIEERFLSARADAFTGSEREEKASAHSARNDRALSSVMVGSVGGGLGEKRRQDALPASG